MAGEIVKVDLPSVGGGLNQSSAPSQIQDNEATVLINWYPEENRLIRRNGCTRITPNAYGETIQGMTGYKKTASWEVVMGVLTSLARLDGTTIVAVPTSQPTVVPSSTEPWSMKQYQNIIYSVRNDGLQLIRYDGAGYGPSGIIPPVGTPTIVQGGAGDLVAGDYVAAVAFRNGVTGAISNSCTQTAPLTLAANKKINWSAIQLPPSGQATQRVLYRSVANQIGVLYRVTILTDVTTTTYIDNIGPDALEDPNSLDNGVPPSGAKMIAFWRERGFLSDGRDLFFSRPYYPESYGAWNYISIAPDDGHIMGGMLPFGDRLLCGKTNAMHYLLGTGPENFTVRTLDDKAACHSHASMRSMEGIAVWFGGEQFYKTDGSQVVGIGDIKLRRALGEIPPQYYQRVSSAYYSKHKWYKATLPGSDGLPAWTAIYDLRSKAWTLFRYHEDLSYAPTCFDEFVDSYYGRMIYGTFGDGHLYRLHNGDLDDGNLITSTWRSKAYDFAKKGQYKRNKRMSFLMYPQDLTEVRSGTVTARLYHDLKTEPENTRDLDVSEIVDYARMGLSSKSKSAKLIQFEMEYTGQPKMEFAEVSFESILYPRGGKVV